MGFLGHTCWVFSLLIGTEDKRINFFFMGLCRGIITFIIAYLLLRFYGMRTDLPSSSDLRKLNTRNGIMTIQAFGMTICVLYLPLPIVYTISNAGPVIVYVIDYLINHTTITRKQLLGIMVSCIGIILAINSHMIYAWLNINEEDQSTF
jgi:drug/metabolite transporter (DMT)-like permease